MLQICNFYKLLKPKLTQQLTHVDPTVTRQPLPTYTHFGVWQTHTESNFQNKEL